jgi:hypothetical protein
MRRVKCKYCNELIDKDDKITLKDTTSTGKVKNTYLHRQCENDYKELMEYKQEEIKWFNEVYEYIKELLGYTSCQQLPKSLITRLYDLRNGTVMMRGVGRVVKSKEGYKYDVILNTFLTNSDTIRWSFDNKIFKNEQNKINYMMAIIDSNINNTYIEMNSKLSNDIIKKRNNLSDSIKPNNINNNILPKKNTGISRFLDEDDF